MIAKRAEMAAAFADKWKSLGLKRAGQAAIAKRDEIASEISAFTSQGASKKSLSAAPPTGFEWGLTA